MTQRAYTVRLPEDEAGDLAALAQVDGVSVAEEIRQAVLARVAERRKDQAFQQRLRQSLAANRRALERLAE